MPSRLACFHAQQAAEKALKAALIAESTPFRKTHDIVVLAGLVPPSLSITLAALDLLVLQPWAVEGRYPGDMSDATDSEADEAVMIAIEVVAVVDRWMRGASAIQR